MQLLDPKFVRSILLTEDDPYLNSHINDADLNDGSSYIGVASLYFILPYIIKAKTCVCLGSGGGLVPKLMRQAQREVKVPDSKTIIVDANMPEASWGEPHWLNKLEHSLRKTYPEIIHLLIKTDDAVDVIHKQFGFIDYLHIDADHSYDGCLNDFLNYKDLMKSGGIISLHDTSTNRPHKHCVPIGVPMVVEHIRTLKEYEIIDFPRQSCGTAFLKKKGE